MVSDIAGIRLQDGKEDMVKARLQKRLRVLQLPGYSQYLDYVKQDGSGLEIAQMVDVLTTNKTNFLREPEHFAFLHQTVLPRLKNKAVTIWSAGCASGEEPYSIAIQLLESIPDPGAWNIKILATDISAKMVGRARAAAYAGGSMAGLPDPWLRRHFIKTGPRPDPSYTVHEAARALVRVARLNLMDEWPMKGKFDVIFCRNVMIYFGKPVQQQLVNRFWDRLRPGGYLFVGHSESLSSLKHQYRYVQPAVWAKP
jgi:chemotaxis protein methyltransferase CheR